MRIGNGWIKEVKRKVIGGEKGKMGNKTALVGILTVVFTVLAVSTAVAIPIPDGYDAIIWLEPDPSSAMPGESITVQMWVNTSVQLGGCADWIFFNPDVVNITNADWTGSALPSETVWENFPCPGGGITNPADCHGFTRYVKVAGMDEELCEPNTGELLLVTLTLEGINPGTSQLYHHPDHVEIFDCDGYYIDAVWLHGNFTCTAPQETYSKDLVEGWNLISLPLTADNMTVSSVFSSVAGKYDAIYSYDATTHSWVALGADDTLENGVGYFIHMTESGTWTYQGSAYTTMNISLEQGLNMIGWLNCSKPIGDALSSIEGNYRYVARWNSTAHKFEVYVPGAPSEFNDFNTMERGEGYFISMKTSDTLTASC